MLVLTRRLKESILIGDDRDIEIVVLAIHHDRVRIGVRANGDVPIVRRELTEEVGSD